MADDTPHRPLEDGLVRTNPRGPTPQEEDFLARMSHELRTPLNAIQGYTDLLIEDKPPGHPDLGDLGAIRRATRHLLALVESVLDLNQLRTGNFQVEPLDLDLAAIVDDVVEAVSEQAQRNKNRLKVEVEAGLEVRSDKRMIRQILFNLVHNACRFTFKGTVSITVRSLDPDWFEIGVRDDGIGMTNAQVEAATLPFWQGDSGTTRRYDGAGVGLAVCKGLAEAMGGKLTIASKMGHGASVMVELPRRAQASGYDFDDEEPTVLLR
ncbi:MAG: HAMP domain-containing histidine kinase [Alphaproteobacteria bacterium]|nr:HAMP domain-containing histidine kinase [Alphaproteobacteria bacterium]